MNSVRRLFMIAAAAIASSASAQLVHLSMEGSFVFTTPSFVPVFKVLSDPAPFRIDAYYNANIPGERFNNYTIFSAVDWREGNTDERNRIRWRSEHDDFTVPINQMILGRPQHDLTLVYSSRIPSLSVVLHLGPDEPLDRLPVPPFALSPIGSELATIGGDYMALQGGSFFIATVTSLEAEFIPVPEPAAYPALAATGLLALVIVQWRIRNVHPKLLKGSDLGVRGNIEPA